MINFVDWQYLTEGGHHVILRYGGEEPIYKGLILRIEKEMPSVNKLQSEQTCERKYLSYVMEPLLSSTFIHHPQAVELDFTFIRELNSDLAADTKRPRKELIADKGTSCVAYLFPDVTDVSYSLLSQPVVNTQLNLHGHCESSTQRSDIQISIEIKVKNGFKSTSPFVSSRVKHACSRYQLNQYAKQYKAQRNNVGMRYGGPFPGISLYDPADMCSREKTRVLHSLQCLLQTPQNNLKISSNGKHVYGWHLLQENELLEGCAHLFSNTKIKQHTEPVSVSLPKDSDSYSDSSDSGEHLLSSPLSPLPLHPSLPSSTPLDSLTQVVSEILCVESALERLRNVQSADMLDVEGMAHVFEVFCQHVSRQCSETEEAGTGAPLGTRQQELELELEQQQEQEQTHYSLQNRALDLIARSLEVGVRTPPLPMQQQQQQQQQQEDMSTSENSDGSESSHSSYSHSHCKPCLESSDVVQDQAYRRPHINTNTHNSTILPYDCDDAHKLNSSSTDEYDSLHHRLRRYQVDETTSAHDLAILKSKCALEIASLTMSECLYLLKLWLVSLAASDASLVVTVKQDHHHGERDPTQSSSPSPSPPDSASGAPNMVNTKQSTVSISPPPPPTMKSCATTTSISTSTSNSTTTSSSSSSTRGDDDDDDGASSGADTDPPLLSPCSYISVCRPQDKSKQGVGSVSVTCPQTRAVTYYTYKVSFLDLGPKPVGKILDKIRKEELLCVQADSVYQGLL